jgi:two-component system CheB/CheR fusion protein
MNQPTRGDPELQRDNPSVLLLRYQQALAASEAQCRLLIAKNTDALLVVGSDGVIRFVNPAAEAMLDRSAAELVGQLFGKPIVPGAITEVDVPRNGGKDIRIAEMRATDITWEGESAYLASLRDITARKRTEETLRILADQAREADRHKSEFLAMLGHELRNPLGTMHTALELLNLPEADAATRQQAQEILHRQVRNMTRLIEDLLDLSRVTRGKISLRRERVDLGQVIAHAVQLVQPLLTERRHQLVVELPPDPVILWADALRLQQVIANLLNNAAKYTDPGGQIWLSAALPPAGEKRTGEAREVVIRVRDTGIGIPVDVLPHVFDPFTQAPQSLDRAGGGLGIGLTLVRSLVEMHGGSVTAFSDGPGRGSEFVVRLPLAVEPAVPEAAATSPGRTSGRHILIVEDNHEHREMLASLLRLWGHQVDTAADGPEGLARALAQPPDVALIDIGLPGLDGYQLAQRLRAAPGSPRPLLVALTGYGQAADRRRAHEAGFDHHLVKPVDLEELRRLLDVAVQRPLGR